ncbi:MAG: hypothetical protein LBD70_05580, partial [Bifidobacteriaceae bacterium]|nr:hypothetical protein [Bifidobacteriaceae bacterium]
PQYETAEFGPAPLVDAVATHDRQSGQTAIFAVNRSTAEPVRLEAEVRSLPGARIGRAVVLSNPDHAWRASAANSDSVSPRPLAATLDDAVVRAALPPLSWSMIRLTG